MSKLYDFRDERRRLSLDRSIRNKQRNLESVEATLNRLDKAMEKETEVELQNSITVSQQYAHMANSASRQVSKINNILASS